jgi:hypothetical protein
MEFTEPFRQAASGRVNKFAYRINLPSFILTSYSSEASHSKWNMNILLIFA